MKKKRLLILLPILAIVVTAALLLADGRRSDGSELELQGNIEIREVRLGFEVSGRIERLLVDEGSRVDSGQLVATLERGYFDDTRRQAEAALAVREAELLGLRNGSRDEEIAQARANTAAARVTFENTVIELRRATNLLAGGAITREQLDLRQAEHDRARAQLDASEATLALVEAGPRPEEILRAEAMVEQARAQLEEAKRRCDDAELRAPSGGVVQTRVHEPGNIVTAGQPIFTITITDPVWVRSYVSGTDLERIQPGMKAVVTTDGGREFVGRLGFISPVAEFTPKAVQTEDIRSDLVYRVRVIADDPNGELRQGMPVTVTLQTSRPGGLQS